MHGFKVKSVRHTPFKPEGVPARTLTFNADERPQTWLCFGVIAGPLFRVQY
jgi:hypothetical protein